MSTIDDDRDVQSPTTIRRLAAAAAPVEELPRFENPIVPDNTIAGRALVAVVAIMTFLASLTTGAVILVRAAASDWQSEVAREVTIQVRPRRGRDIEADVQRAADIARELPGVADVRAYSREEFGAAAGALARRGLEARRPAGAAHHRGAARADAGARPRRAAPALAGRAVPSASLDDHRSFVDRMRAMANAARVRRAWRCWRWCCWRPFCR